MLGGRKFSRAFVDVWRASQKERHPLIGRRFYQGRRNAHVVWVQTLNVTSATPLTENLDIAGVSLFLEPRNVHTPIFRADLRYFELNHGGLWWFVGSVDLIISASSSTSIFAKEAKLVYSHWKQLCEKHRSIIPFVRDPSQEPIPFGNLLGDFDTVERGRSRAFAFTNDVMDSLLSVYLPLTRKQSPSFKQLKRNKSRNPHLGFFHLDPSAESSYTWDTYSLSGGTVLESSFCEEAPLAMWRFNLFPPPGTAAAKVIAELRSGRNSSQIDPLGYIGWF
ncbi:coproporphyrinogen III oxidase isoform 2 [Galdieria sulphuraria]|nr:coproporphyrinogen III oxidase isoform 2 [Galdieria sulphuraria]EME31216.1 coproporphyrinogen III oxidase isoform 2 [Galdieria sulphuraria]|eukprot:XP_005707736.1 coproporphyrinogen III oxidase isoform 2 [Galdieria sulphuraria]